MRAVANNIIIQLCLLVLVALDVVLSDLLSHGVINKQLLVNLVVLNWVCVVIDLLS